MLHLPGDRESPERYVEGVKILPPKGRHFGISQRSLNIAFNEGRVRFNGKEQVEIFVDSEELNNNWTDIEGYSFGWDFSTENSESLLKRVIESSSNEGDLVIDFFLGSGTTTAVAHKVKRKWIGVERGGHFHGFDTEKGPSGILVRMKEVLAGKGNHEPSGISKDKEINWKGGGFFKYQVLEQYEDALDNLELKPNEEAQKLFKDDYLLKYFLEFETQDSPNFLDIEHLKDPFSYKLKVNFEEMGEPVEAVVDIPETFNYLLGLKVKKIKARPLRLAQGDKRKYLFILGEKEGVNIAVVWRKVDDNWDEDDFRKDKEFIIKELKAWMPQRIYINSQSILTTNLEGHPVEVHYIEPEFKTLMFS